jgi:exonuclease VII small subunit
VTGAACRTQLEAAETRVEILTRKGDKVQPEPWNPDKT